MDPLEKPHVVIVVDNGTQEEESRNLYKLDGVKEQIRRNSLGESGSGNVIVKEEDRGSSTVSSMHLESGQVGVETKQLQVARVRECRICHMRNLDADLPIELGCSCKDDLATAHRQCAEAWFQLKGNKRCEICNSIARNVADANESESLEEQWNGANDTAVAMTIAPTQPAEARNFWQRNRVLVFLVGWLVLAFVVSLCKFNVPA